MTGAAVLGGGNKNTDRADAQSVFLTGMVDLPLRGINFDPTYPHQIKSTNHLTVIGTFWWGMVDLPLRGINFDSTSPPIKIPTRLSADRYFGGGWWIRTTEGIASRFTVCPLWPLGNTPICT